MKKIIENIKEKYLLYWKINKPAMIMIHGFLGVIIIFKIIGVFI